MTVIEASAEAIEIARRRVPERVKFNCSTIEQMDFMPAFSSIFMINTLEHLEDARAALVKARSWLAEDGKLYVLVPNADAASRQIAVHMGVVDDAYVAGCHRLGEIYPNLCASIFSISQKAPRVGYEHARAVHASGITALDHVGAQGVRRGHFRVESSP